MTKEEFARTLQGIADRHNLDAPGLARYLGTPVPTVKKWLRGEREPSATAVRLVRVMGMLEFLAPDIHDALKDR